MGEWKMKTKNLDQNWIGNFFVRGGEGEENSLAKFIGRKQNPPENAKMFCDCLGSCVNSYLHVKFSTL